MTKEISYECLKPVNINNFFKHTLSTELQHLVLMTFLSDLQMRCHSFFYLGFSLLLSVIFGGKFFYFFLEGYYSYEE